MGKILKNRFQIIVTAAILFFAAVSCNQSGYYESYNHIPNAKWHQDSIQTFSFVIDSTTESRLFDIAFNVRNTAAYPYQNLWLFLDFEKPDSTVVRDSVNIMLCAPSGKWYGTGIGDLYDNQYPYQQAFAMQDTGRYSLRIQHGMRTSNGRLKGINDVGVSLFYADK